VAEIQPAIGTLAPDFEAPDEKGEPWHLTDALERSRQVLIFYRGDW
jgi:peroxiredoxin